MSGKVSRLCAGCVKITEGGLCLAIKEPEYFWERYGKCFAFSDDPGWLDRYRREARKYAEARCSKTIKQTA